MLLSLTNLPRRPKLALILHRLGRNFIKSLYRWSHSWCFLKNATPAISLKYQHIPSSFFTYESVVSSPTRTIKSLSFLSCAGLFISHVIRHYAHWLRGCCRLWRKRPVDILGMRGLYLHLWLYTGVQRKAPIPPKEPSVIFTDNLKLADNLSVWFITALLVNSKLYLYWCLVWDRISINHYWFNSVCRLGKTT